ncbi:MAG: manganese efflux pump MntP family protein [Peptococcaceae bacterium]|nr:manganese efflux pump MntP family protein [Peptococcaceae bacterium]
MTWLDMLLVAVGLAMDASVVAAANGMVMERPGIGKASAVGLTFGLFQGLMPLIGYFTGAVFSLVFARAAHWIAFGLLAMVGINMIRESLEEEEAPANRQLSPGRLLVQAVATSLDALAVGVGFALVEADVFSASGVIAAVTAVLSFSAVHIGHRFGNALAGKAALAGGLILILMGLKLAIY